MPILFSLFLPAMNIPLFEKSNVLLSLVINNSPMNWFPISNFLLCPKSHVQYIPLLCQIWPQVLQKRSLFYQKVLEWYKHVFQIHNFPPFCRQSSIHSSANYIHCSVKLSVTVHNSLSKLISLVWLTFCLRVVTWVRSDWAPM